jgi:hypothetical protein
MPVNIYVSRDSEGRPWPPTVAHEIRALEEVIKNIWLAFNHVDNVYAVFANLRQPSADMVVLTERGIGVLEFKDHPGKMTVDNEDRWFANGDPIKGGRYASPHLQVQAYAEEVRRSLLTYIAPKWLRMDQWDSLKFQTAVCFTHPAADISEILKATGQLSRRNWESTFNVVTPANVAEWILSLCFEKDLGSAKGFEPYLLDSETVVNLAVTVLHGVEWSDLVRIMPDGKPYGYLVLTEQGRETQTFNLFKEVSVLGRDPENCQTIIPERFKMASRQHAEIRRTLREMLVEDKASRHGTYLNSKRLEKPHSLKNGDVITLGGPHATSEICALRFTRLQYRLGIGQTASSTD